MLCRLHKLFIVCAFAMQQQLAFCSNWQWTGIWNLAIVRTYQRLFADTSTNTNWKMLVQLHSQRTKLCLDTSCSRNCTNLSFTFYTSWGTVSDVRVWKSLNTEEVCSFETSAISSPAVQHNEPEDVNRLEHCRRNLISLKLRHSEGHIMFKFVSRSRCAGKWRRKVW